MSYPMFNPYYSQMQNPYSGMQMQIPQPVFQQQQPQIQQPQNVLQGKVVEGFENFKAMDIPMDGSVYYFPKADGSEIYSKRWLQNGSTQQLVYKLQTVEDEEKPNPFMEKLNAIEEKIVALEEIISAKPKATKKEGDK